MKTMTCRQLGGPFDLAHHVETADDVINAQDQHLRDAVKSGDASHEQANAEMRGRWKHPVKSMGWYRDMKKAFAEMREISLWTKDAPSGNPREGMTRPLRRRGGVRSQRESISARCRA